MSFLPKMLVRKLVRFLICPEAVWSRIPRLLRETAYLRVQRNQYLEEEYQSAVEKLKGCNTVLNGPFSGMQLTSVDAVGCEYPPRVLGSYESELHVTISQSAKQPYEVIVDVGFAEGYYLVGLGLQHPRAKLVGFDINVEVHRLCKDLAKANGINENRMLLCEGYAAASLDRVLPQRSLVLCDCEGYEIDVFCEENLQLWAESDLLIECHDFIENGIEKSLIERLHKTHEITVVRTSESGKISFTEIPLLAKFSRECRARLVSEGRPAEQSWIFAVPRIDQQPLRS